MALYNCNNKGKKDIVDNFNKYKVYKESIKKSNYNDNNYNSNRVYESNEKTNKNDVATFRSILSIVLGLAFTAVLFTVLDVNIDDVHVLGIFFIWLINSSIIAFIATIIGF